MPETVVRASLTLHKNLVRVSDEDFVELEFVKPLDRKKLLHNEVLMIAASHMALSTYRNSLLHVYIRTALVALSINNCSQDSLSTGKFSFLIDHIPSNAEATFVPSPRMQRFLEII